MSSDSWPTEWLRAVLTSSWREGVGGPGRKFFAVTAQGRAHLDARVTAWASFTERFDEMSLTEYRRELILAPGGHGAQQAVGDRRPDGCAVGNRAGVRRRDWPVQLTRPPPRSFLAYARSHV